MTKRDRKKFKKDRPPDPFAVGTPWRLFIAIPLPTNIVELIEAITNDLSDADLPIRWVAAGNAHLTLHFLGDTEAERAELLRFGLAPAVNTVKRFELRVEGRGVFPNQRSPRVVWLGLVGQTKQLATMHANLAKGLKSFDFPVEDRSFSPHITLGRVRDAAPSDTGPRLLRALNDPAVDRLLKEHDGAFTVDRVHLIRSFLGREGSRYETLQSYDLQ
jgi:RNA 2',3'-cyclic 3'-phosphodiesterase